MTITPSRGVDPLRLDPVRGLLTFGPEPERKSSWAREGDDRALAFRVTRPLHFTPQLSHLFKREMHYVFSDLGNVQNNPLFRKVFRMIDRVLDMMEGSHVRELDDLFLASVRVRQQLAKTDQQTGQLTIAQGFESTLLHAQDSAITAETHRAIKDFGKLRDQMLMIPVAMGKKYATELASLGITSVASLKKRQAELQRCVSEATQANLRSAEFILLAIKADEAMAQAKFGELSSQNQEIINKYRQMIKREPDGPEMHAEISAKLAEGLNQLNDFCHDSMPSSLKMANEEALEEAEVNSCKAFAARMIDHLNQKDREMLRLRPKLGVKEGIKCDYLRLMSHLMFPSLVNRMIELRVRPLIASRQGYVDHMTNKWLRGAVERELKYSKESMAESASEVAKAEKELLDLKDKVAKGLARPWEVQMAQVELEYARERYKSYVELHETSMGRFHNFDAYAKHIFSEKLDRIARLKALIPLSTPFDQMMSQFLHFDDLQKKRNFSDMSTFRAIPDEVAQGLATPSVERERERMKQELERQCLLFAKVTPLAAAATATATAAAAATTTVAAAAAAAAVV